MSSLLNADVVVDGELDGYHVHVPNRFMEEGITILIQCVYISANAGPDEVFQKIPVAQSSSSLLTLSTLDQAMN